MKQIFFTGFTVVLFALSLIFAGFATAEESGSRHEEEIIITGMVEQKGTTFILQTIDGDEYTMTGLDLSDMVGKKVQAGGELIKDKNKNSMNVNYIIEFQEKDINKKKTLYQDAEK